MFLSLILLFTLSPAAARPPWADPIVAITPPPTFVGYVDTPIELGSHFRKVGYTSTATEFVHLEFEFPFSQMARASSNLRNAIKSSKFHSPLYSPFDHQLDNLIARLDRLRASPTHTQFRKFPHHRGKRFVITAIAAGLAAISLGASIYTALETSTLAARTNSLKSAQLSEVLQM